MFLTTAVTRALPAALLLAALLAVLGCQTGSTVVNGQAVPAAAPVPGTLHAWAEGRAEAVPDIAVVRMSIETSGRTVRGARTQAAGVTRAVIDELARQGVEDRNIRTSRFSIRADYEYTDDGRRRLTGYQVSHALTVEIANLESVGAAIDALSEAGGDTLAFHDIEFAYADPERLLEEARRNAVETLQRHAQQLAAAANRELGPLLEITELSGAPDSGPPRPYLAAEMMARARPVDTPISSGSGTVSVTVRGVFELR